MSAELTEMFDVPLVIDGKETAAEPRAVTINTSGETPDWYDDAGPPKRLN